MIQSAPVWLPQTQTWMFEQLRALPHCFENHIVCERTEHLDQFPTLRVHSHEALPCVRQLWDRRLRAIGLRRHLSHLPEKARAVGARLLHSHFGNTGWNDWRVARRLSMRHVVTFYGHDLSLLPSQDPGWLSRYHELFEHVDLVLCEGTHMSHTLMELGCPRERIRVHHLGVDTQAFAFQPRQLREGEPFRILIAASFTEKKGIPDALAALGQLACELPLAITLIGDSSGGTRNDAEKERILATLDRLGLAPKTRWLGYQPHQVFLREAYEHHVYLSPSTTASDGDCEGGAPVGLIEMAATGMPVVSTRHCDIPEVIEDGVGGLLSDEGDVDGLAAHLRQLAHRPERWLELARSARCRIEEQYDVRRQSQKLAALYHSLL